MKIKFKKLDNFVNANIPLPEYKTDGSAGMDVRACIKEKIVVKQGSTVMIPLGFAMHIEDKNIAAIIIPRSGLGSKNGIVLGNLVGLIDSDYQGELMVPLWNRSNKDFDIKPGDRIAQMVFIPLVLAEFEIVNSFEQSERGIKGFGSSGVE
ncbi:MAG: dUTP diphosphatase [Gammaproteobacteria bacterium]|jgi:dUTP pyrophosphatase|uniref:Deoxyuridine 5'-triphosphate nucleotidohydrolase n=1 Tax=SAR86 cluster bacterium SAR86B TaxID=1123867 RepID=J5KFK5_9GAMM|nr:MAG: dUTP diphosphatase [SAR86 cluster bacterium SAR86B]|tara:strand:- start:165 stop:617 length:453 start_codon:yes stop_codon:yes gene_type:complete